MNKGTSLGVNSALQLEKPNIQADFFFPLAFVLLSYLPLKNKEIM